jgi:ketosteroid isomerase-like protein
MSEVSIHPETSALFLDRLYPAYLEGDPRASGKGHESDNVRRLEAQYRAIARGELQTAAEGMADDVVLELSSPANLPLAGRWAGLADVFAAMGTNYGSLAEQRAELLSVIAQGSDVVVFAEEKGKVRASGEAYHVRWMQVFTFRDGKIAGIRGVAAPTL